MFNAQNVTQRIFSKQETFLPILVESFRTDRKAAGLTRRSVEFYKNKLSMFLAYCESQSITDVSQVTTDFLRKYLLFLAESHNPGGVHAVFRSIRAFMRWIEFDDIIPDWKDPIKKVRSPKVDIPPSKVS